MSMSESELVDLLFPYVRSIFGAKNEETPEFVGSGVLLKNHGGLYLITAAHVMDHFDGTEYPLFLDGVNSLVEISGEEVCSYTKDPIKRRDDKQDISIVKLSNKIQACLDSAYFIEFKNIFRDNDSQLGYFCFGVPVKKGDKSIDKNKRRIISEPYGLHANESDVETYRKLNVSKSTHLVLDFNVKKAYAQDDKKRTAPALHGFSGAPIWGFRRNGDAEIQAGIVAILTEYHQGDIKAILGTRIDEVLRGGCLTIQCINVNNRCCPRF